MASHKVGEDGKLVKSEPATFGLSMVSYRQPPIVAASYKVVG